MTDQKYGSDASGATPTPPAAHSAAQIPSVVDQRQENLRFAQKGADDYAETIVTLVSEYLGESRVIPTLSAILNDWMMNADLAAEQNRRHLTMVFDLISFLDNVRSYNNAKEINEQWVADLTKEGEEGHE